MKTVIWLKKIYIWSLKVIDFCCVDGTLKMNNDPTLRFLLLSHFTINKPPVTLSGFHEQVLLDWNHFSPHFTILCYSRYSYSAQCSELKMKKCIQEA